MMNNTKHTNRNSNVQLSLFPDLELTREAGKEKSEPDHDLEEFLARYDHSELFNRLAQSDFRRGFHLKAQDKAYIKEKGLNAIRKHAEDFVAKRLAPAFIPNDGKQTPMRGHPVFIAQHATGCCCRGCFSKWHQIPGGRQLTEREQQYAVSVLMEWIKKEYSL